MDEKPYLMHAELLSSAFHRRAGHAPGAAAPRGDGAAAGEVRQSPRELGLDRTHHQQPHQQHCDPNSTASSARLEGNSFAMDK